MRFLAFFLSFFVYGLILFFLYSILVYKKPQKKEVLVHTAIVPKVTKKVTLKKQVVKKQIQKSKKVAKKLKSKSALTKGGEDIKFDDIFKNVNYNIKSRKIKQKANLDMSKFKGIEKRLNKIKNMNINITVKSNNSKKVNMSKITQKLGKVWDVISVNNGEYAIIRVISKQGKVSAFILDTNLDVSLQEELITQIESLSFRENFDISVKFQTKGN